MTRNGRTHRRRLEIESQESAVIVLDDRVNSRIHVTVLSCVRRQTAEFRQRVGQMVTVWVHDRRPNALVGSVEQHKIRVHRPVEVLALKGDS